MDMVDISIISVVFHWDSQFSDISGIGKMGRKYSPFLAGDFKGGIDPANILFLCILFDDFPCELNSILLLDPDLTRISDSNNDLSMLFFLSGFGIAS